MFLRLSGVAGACGLLLYLCAVYLWTTRQPGTTELPSSLETLTTLEAIRNGVALILTITTYILYLMWLHRVIRQICLWGGNVGATPGWAIGYWFIPFVNLVMPFRIVQRIVRELGGWSLAASLHLGVWWGAFLLSRMLDRLSSNMSTPSVSLLILPSYYVKIASLACTTVAAFLCVRIVREVQERLDARRSDL